MKLLQVKLKWVRDKRNGVEGQKVGGRWDRNFSWAEMSGNEGDMFLMKE